MVSRRTPWRRTRITATVLCLAAVVGVTAIAITAYQNGDTLGACSTGTAAPAADLPRVAGFSDAQVQNADAILAAGTRLGASQRDLTIGIMTAIGESSLCVLDHGDAAGPDSRGLFQQRPAWWGSEAERMDPDTSATRFYTALLKLDDRTELEPTIAAHRVQRNADPQHYARFWDRAVTLVAALDTTAREHPEAINLH